MGADVLEFELVGIKTEQFACFEENLPAKKKAISLNTNLEFGVNQAHKILTTAVTFTFENAKKVFIKIEVRCDFIVSEATWKFFNQKEELVFRKGFIRHLSMLCVGTARGVLHAKTEGTAFNEFILPTINVEELVEEDAHIRLEG